MEQKLKDRVDTTRFKPATSLMKEDGCGFFVCNEDNDDLLRRADEKVDSLALSKIDQEDKIVIMKLYANGLSYKDILRRFNLRKKHQWSIKNILDVLYDPNNSLLIERFREEYLSNIKQVPIANKRIRLEEYDLNRKNIKLMISKLDPGESHDRFEASRLIKGMNETLSRAREELEGSSTQLTQIQVNQYTNMSDEELYRRRDELIRKAQGKIEDAVYEKE